MIFIQNKPLFSPAAERFFKPAALGKSLLGAEASKRIQN